MTTLSITIKDSLLDKLHSAMKRFGEKNEQKYISKVIGKHVEELEHMPQLSEEYAEQIKESRRLDKQGKLKPQTVEEIMKDLCE